MLAPKAAKAQTRASESPARKQAQQSSMLAARPFAAPRERARELLATESGEATSVGTFPAFSFGRLSVQRKLTVGRTDDPLEHEADAVADQVMRMPDPALSIGPGPLQISRKCAACEQEDEDQEKLQMKPAYGSQPQTGEPPAIVHNVLRSPGQPLDAASRAYFEPRFGHDFSGVRLHTDGRAAESARSIGASAYTAGANIAFAEGRYSPATSSGRRLLAHELTHVVQQRALSPGGALPEGALIQRDVDSDFYKQGYQDGVAGKEAQPLLVWNEDATNDYNAGYAKGHSEFIQQQPSPEVAPGGTATQPQPTPSPAPVAPQPSVDATQPAAQPDAQADAGAAPAPSAPAQAQQGPDPNSPAYKQGYDDAQNGRPSQPAAPLNEDAVADYNAGYAEGSAPGPVAAPAPTDAGAPPQPTHSWARDLTDEDEKSCSPLYMQKLCVFIEAGLNGDRSGPRPADEQMRGYNVHCRDESGYPASEPDVQITDSEIATLRSAKCQRPFTTGEKILLGAFLIGAAAVGIAVTIAAAEVVIPAVIASVEGSAVVASLGETAVGAYAYYLGNAIVVNEIGLFAAGLVIACEGDVAGLLNACAKDPLQCAPLLAEVYILHVNISVANGPPRPANVPVKLLPPEQQDVSTRQIKVKTAGPPQFIESEEGAPTPTPAVPSASQGKPTAGQPGEIEQEGPPPVATTKPSAPQGGGGAAPPEAKALRVEGLTAGEKAQLAELRKQPGFTEADTNLIGILIDDETGAQYPVRAGEHGGPAAGIHESPKGKGSGYTGYTQTHVEGHAGDIMRAQGIKKATLLIPVPPCDACDASHEYAKLRATPNVSAMIPKDARLTVVFDDSASTYWYAPGGHVPQGGKTPP